MSSDKLIIYACPDPGEQAEIKLKDRESELENRPVVKWEKDPEWVENNPDADFDFIGLVPIKTIEDDFDNPFKEIDVKKNRIQCKFEGFMTGPDYKYTIAIEYNGKALNSDIENPEGPTEGRAVIRN